MKFIHTPKLFRIISCILVGLFFSTCQNLLPTDLQEKDNYRITDFDAHACSILSNDSLFVDTLRAAYIDSIATDWTLASDSLIDSLYDTLSTEIPVVLLNPDITKTTFYTLFQQVHSSGRYFFISWDLSQDNLQVYISMDIYSKSGQSIRLVSNSLALETTAGCTEWIEIGGVDTAVPKIRARYKFNLDTGIYLVKFYISKPDVVTNFKMIVM